MKAASCSSGEHRFRCAASVSSGPRSASPSRTDLGRDEPVVDDELDLAVDLAAVQVERLARHLRQRGGGEAEAPEVAGPPDGPGGAAAQDEPVTAHQRPPGVFEDFARQLHRRLAGEPEREGRRHADGAVVAQLDGLQAEAAASREVPVQPAAVVAEHEGGHLEPEEVVLLAGAVVGGLEDEEPLAVAAARAVVAGRAPAAARAAAAAARVELFEQREEHRVVGRDRDVAAVAPIPAQAAGAVPAAPA